MLFGCTKSPETKLHYTLCTYIVTQDGDSALTLAARHGLTDGVVELVKSGANLNLQNNVWEMASTMLPSIVDMSFVTQNGDSALTLAARNGLTDVVVELLKAGANLDLQNKV